MFKANIYYDGVYAKTVYGNEYAETGKSADNLVKIANEETEFKPLYERGSVFEVSDFAIFKDFCTEHNLKPFRPESLEAFRKSELWRYIR